MSKHNQYKRLRPEEFLRYISGEMSDRERHDFERIMQQDLFASDALEGLSVQGTKEIREDLSKLQSRLDRRTGKQSSAVWIRIAASVAVIVVLGTLYFTVFTDRLGRMDRMVTRTETADTGRVETTSPEKSSPVAGKEETAAEQEKATGGTGNEAGRARAVQSDSRQQQAKAEPSGKVKEEPVLEEVLDEEQMADTEIIVTDREITAGERSAAQDTSARPDITPPVAIQSGLARTASPEAEDTLGTGGTMQVYEQILPEEETSAALSGKSAAGPAASEMMQSTRMEKRAPTLRPATMMVPDSIPAQPMVGWEAFNRYIEINRRVPQDDSLNQPVSVRLHFFIDPEGHPRDIEVDDSPGEPFSSEAIRLLREGPQWKPAVLHGVTSRGPFPLRIEFKKR